jgi:hypothetical protein
LHLSYNEVKLRFRSCIEVKILMNKGAKHQERLLKVVKSFSRNPTAYLLLKGCWLEKAGFTVGDNVRVEVYNQHLIITVLNEID